MLPPFVPTTPRPHRSVAALTSLVLGLLLVSPGGQAHAAGPPWMYLGGLERTDCNRSYAAAAAYYAMKQTGFSAAPYVEPNYQYVMGVNGDTKVIVTVDPLDQTHFWF